MVIVPAGRAAVPVTIRKSPAVLLDGNDAEMLETCVSAPLTALCTRRTSVVGGGDTPCDAKSTPVALAPFTVTVRLDGVIANPFLPGVTVYVPFTSPLNV